MAYQCRFCKQTFSHKRSVGRHLDIHSSERRLRCSRCEAAFNRSDSFKHHMARHDKVESQFGGGFVVKDGNESATGYICSCAETVRRPDDLQGALVNHSGRFVYSINDSLEDVQHCVQGHEHNEEKRADRAPSTSAEGAASAEHWSSPSDLTNSSHEPQEQGNPTAKRKRCQHDCNEDADMVICSQREPPSRGISSLDARFDIIKEYTCTSCLGNFKQPEHVKLHFTENHSQVLYICKICQEMMESNLQLQDHAAREHLHVIKFYRCKRCLASFSTLMDFNIHVRSAHAALDQQ